MFERDRANRYAQCSDGAAQQGHAMHLSESVSSVAEAGLFEPERANDP